MTNVCNSFFTLLYKEQKNKVGFFSLRKKPKKPKNLPPPQKKNLVRFMSEVAKSLVA